MESDCTGLSQTTSNDTLRDGPSVSPSDGPSVSPSDVPEDIDDHIMDIVLKNDLMRYNRKVSEKTRKWRNKYGFRDIHLQRRHYDSVYKFVENM